MAANTPRTKSFAPRRLPTFAYRGRRWTVDERLREFRYAEFEEGLEFVAFDSEKGIEMLRAYLTETVTSSSRVNLDG